MSSSWEASYVISEHNSVCVLAAAAVIRWRRLLSCEAKELSRLLSMPEHESALQMYSPCAVVG